MAEKESGWEGDEPNSDDISPCPFVPIPAYLIFQGYLGHRFFTTEQENRVASALNSCHCNKDGKETLTVKDVWFGKVSYILGLPSAHASLVIALYL